MTEQDKLIKLFYHILKRMKKEWNHQIRGINHSQYLILNSLNHSGPQKAAQLAELTQNTPGAITSATDKLVAEGYAMRKGDACDRRVVYLEITDAGRELANSLSQALNEVTMQFFQGLPEEDIQHLIRIYNKISENLDQCKC
ncbi:MAG: transcriptional regulator [Bacillota bacterium]|jgi:DNA-binding MarR family transcriptional regulator|nr:transcriptional regulator [Bacillota bacterium]